MSELELLPPPTGEDASKGFVTGPSNLDARVDVHIVPWALAREEIPIQVRWKPDFSFVRTTLLIPEGFEFVEFANVDEVRNDGLIATVERLKVSGGRAACYFGFTIRCKNIPKEIRYEKPVVVTFLGTAGNELSRTVTARVFRPLLEFVNAPGDIELTDHEAVKSLPLRLRYRGFGDIQLQVQAIIEGRIVSEGTSIVFEILRRLWLDDKMAGSVNLKPKDRKRTLAIAPSYVKSIAAEVQHILDTGEMPAEVFDSDTSSDIREWLNDVRHKNRFMDLLYSRTEDMLLNLLVDLLENHPVSNVSLVDSRSKVTTHIKAPIENLTLRLMYRDLLGNEYDPVEFTIKIIDRRTKGKPSISIPIVVDKWDDKRLLNVAGS